MIKCPNCQDSPTIELKADGKFQVFFCTGCLNGFTYPVPAGLAKYYPGGYWIPQGWKGFVKEQVYKLTQKRRQRWIKKYLSSGKILDVGAGEGVFIETMKKQFSVVGIEPPFSKIKNQHIIKIDFLKWQTKQKFDAVVFWESLEHTRSPQKYLEKAYNLLKKGGLVFIEYPVLDCLESKIFGRFWYHLDLPRHLAHLTEKGLGIITAKAGFKKIDSKDVFALEYTLPGFLASLLNISKVKLPKTNLLLLAVPLFIPVLAVELLFYVLHQAPIGIMIARKV